MKAAEKTKEMSAEIHHPLAMSHRHRLNRIERGGSRERAIVIAREHHAKSRELRATMNMVRLWCDQGKQRQGHDIHKT